METIKQPIGMPSQCEATAKAFVKAYGKDKAVHNINNNIKGLENALLSMDKERFYTRLNLAQQSDFWSQVLQSIKH